ncbi:pilus assembly protein TadG-related protein [Ammoniphilus resinae]|uniref:Putative Flp pilus-assembly TadG-like N-terminal domain-containing protein n=1 Tax=Ammoniphilus resinae TaxID=861532 RepID=A0ABS4GKA8_9BACL|nr:Tad domain-containing protein [Ammoniphilus resinae]MBP1930701.1 hypothetical protein [Ammoniphilus resinae]
MTKLRDENGSISILAIYTVLLVVAATFLISHFFHGYVVKRQSQNVADSAALAAVQVLKEKYEEEMKQRVELELLDFWNEINFELADCLATGLTPCLTKEELVQDKIQNPDLEAKLLAYLLYPAGEIDWLLVMKEPYFAGEFTARKNGDVLYDVCRREASLIHSVSVDLASKNQGENQLSLTFPVEGEPKLLVEGSKKLEVDTIVQFSGDIPSASAAGISADFDIDVSHKTPFTF